MKSQLSRTKFFFEQKEKRFEELDKTLSEAGLTKDVDPEKFFAERQKEIDADKRKIEDEMAKIEEELRGLEEILR